MLHDQEDHLTCFCILFSHQVRDNQFILMHMYIRVLQKVLCKEFLRSLSLCVCVCVCVSQPHIFNQTSFGQELEEARRHNRDLQRDKFTALAKAKETVEGEKHRFIEETKERLEKVSQTYSTRKRLFVHRTSLERSFFI